jgi:hypothetical protein
MIHGQQNIKFLTNFLCIAVRSNWQGADEGVRVFENMALHEFIEAIKWAEREACVGKKEIVAC